MLYPNLRPLAEKRQMLSTFLGLNRTDKISDGAFYDMENLTSDHFPLLCPRKARSVYAETTALGIIATDVMEWSESNTERPALVLCYADAKSHRLVVGDQATNLGIDSKTHKWLVRMGAYVLVFPDKKYINTLDTSDCGDIEIVWETKVDLALTPCGPDGGQGSGCVKLSGGTVPTGFAAGDCIILSNFSAAPHLNGITQVRAVGSEYLVVDGTLDQPVTQPPSDFRSVTIARSVPDMDFVVECGNRLWGCRYGKDDEGKMINQIYCSKLGDFKNWNTFQGLSTDAWVASVGSYGPFTGAVSYLGNPLFFKENCLHKVYISAEGAHQVVDTVCRGIQLGAGRSAAVVGETLYYKATGGVMAYDGAFPRSVSDDLGAYRFSEASPTAVAMHNGQCVCAVGGGAGSKYYLSMTDQQYKPHLLVYDTVRDLWHREDSTMLLHACTMGQQLYGVDMGGDIWLLSGTLPAETDMTWYAVSGDLGLESPDKKYISRLTLRLALNPDSLFFVDICYDHSGIWENVCTIRGDRLGSFPVSIQPRRCDHLQLRLRGSGDMKLYSLTKTVTEGSDEI